MLMLKESGKLACALFVMFAARVAVAQDDASPSDEVQDLKRRLEILEKEKADRDAKNNAPPAVSLMDPWEDKWYNNVHVGGGVRATFRSATGGAPDTHHPSEDFALESGRLYTGGKITDYLSATLNAEFTAGGASVLDAIAQIKVANEFNIFMGRMLPATDRSNSDGPYYLSTWDFPFLSDAFNAASGATNVGDRDNGITFWGDVGNFKYWVGAYEGHQAPLRRDDLLYAARVQYDFFDAETGYYLTSTYYGDKKILAIGLVANYQNDATGTTLRPESSSNVAVDFLWEQKLDVLADGTATVEAAYYYYGRHGFAPNPAYSTLDLGAGTGFMATVAYLIPGKVGWGQFQPHIRYQGFDDATSGIARNPTNRNESRWDFGTNYVMAGHNARISLVYSHIEHRFEAPNKQTGMLTLGTQFQF